MSSLLSAVLFSGVAQAFSGNWTFSGHWGHGDLDYTTDSGEFLYSDINDSSSMFGVSAHYRLMNNLGVRAMYERGDYHSRTYCSPGDDVICTPINREDNTRFESWSLALVPRLRVAPMWSVYGTLGIADMRHASGEFFTGQSETAVIYGGGLRANFLPRTHVSLEYEMSDFDYSVARLSLGVRF
ncbi:outer membrane beta-barrel protein [Aliidiomarina minuta]|nr:outer membrane beta-barrel protein [Aliidiomarina minuta]